MTTTSTEAAWFKSLMDMKFNSLVNVGNEVKSIQAFRKNLKGVEAISQATSNIIERCRASYPECFDFSVKENRRKVKKFYKVVHNLLVAETIYRFARVYDLQADYYSKLNKLKTELINDVYGVMKKESYKLLCEEVYENNYLDSSLLYKINEAYQSPANIFTSIITSSYATHENLTAARKELRNLIPQNTWSTNWANSPLYEKMFLFLKMLFFEFCVVKRDERNTSLVNLKTNTLLSGEFSYHYNPFFTKRNENQNEESFYDQLLEVNRQVLENFNQNMTRFISYGGEVFCARQRSLIALGNSYSPTLLRRRVESVVLDDDEESVDLGEFTVLVDLFSVFHNHINEAKNSNGETNAENNYIKPVVAAIATNPVLNVEGFTHPHVSRRCSTCLGDGVGGFYKMQEPATLSFVGMLDILEAVISNYSQGDAYEGAELYAWYDPESDSRYCDCCSDTIPRGEEVHYTYSDEVICEACLSEYYVYALTSPGNASSCLVHIEDTDVVYSEHLDEYLFIDRAVEVVSRNNGATYYFPDWDLSGVVTCERTNDYVLEDEAVRFDGDYVCPRWYSDNVMDCPECGNPCLISYGCDCVPEEEDEEQETEHV